MAPQWMPQNIQKRLLRYVLQQLSLFSEIDLPNLDVSLGTNSKVVLREVQLDSEKISIPGVFLRDGKVNNLELLLTVGGGVNIEAKGIEMILAPSANTSNTNKKGKFSLAQSTADLANSIMVDRYDGEEEDEEEDDKVESSMELSDTDADSSKRQKLGEDANPSRLNAVMTRAAELALSRMKVELYDINITVIADSVTVAIHIEHVSFNSTDGIRSIKFSGLEMTLVSPKVSPGEFPDNSNLNNLSATTEESESEEEEEEEDMYGYDDEDNDMMSSSFLGDKKESLMDSMVFSHEEASSLYMSATSHLLTSSFGSTRLEIPTRLMYLNEGEITFQGFQDIEDSNISIDEINIAATPWPTALAGILHTVKRILKLVTLQKKPYKNTKAPLVPSKSPIRIDIEAPDDDDINDDDAVTSEDDESDDGSMFFDNVSITKVTMDLNSALSNDGVFMTDDSLRLVLQTVKLAQESYGEYRGFIDTFKILKKDTVVLELDQSFEIDEADITLKYDKLKKNGETDMNISISKPLILNLDLQSVHMLIKLVNGLRPLLDYLESSSSSSSLPTSATPKLPNTAAILRGHLDPRRYNHFNYNQQHQQKQQSVLKPSTKDPEPFSKFHFHMEPIEMNLQITPDVSVKCIVLPISFNNIQNTLTIDQILVSLIILGSNNPTDIVSIKNISYCKFTTDEIVKTFGITSSNKFDVSNLNTSTRLSIDCVDLFSDYSDLKALISAINSFTSSLSALQSTNSTTISSLAPTANFLKSKKKVRLNNTTFFQKSLTTFFNLDKLTLKIANVNDKFGDAFLKLDNITANIFKNSSLCQFFVMNGSCSRIHNDVIKEQCFGIASVEDNKSPIIAARLREKTIINVYLRNVILDYYTEWLSYFDNLEEKPPPPQKSEKRQKDSPAIVASDTKKKKFEIRTSLSDCIIGLNPGRLVAKALVVIKRGNADLYFGTELSIKSSLKTLSVLLIDDVANILSDIETKNLRQWNSLRANMNAPSWSQVSNFISKGYVSVASVNAVHSSIVFNNETSFKNNKSNSAKSLVDMKINSDIWNVELCADSAQCFISLLNDLKQPVNITFDEKYKPNVDVDLNIFDEIENFAYQKEENSSSLSISKLSTSNSENTTLKSGLSLVDSYYGSVKSSDHATKPAATGSDDSSVAGVEEDLQSTIFFNDKHFDNKNNNSTETLNDVKIVEINPISLYFGAAKIVINLYDGYDWKETRDTISGVFKRVQAKLAQLAKTSNQGSLDNSESTSRGSNRRDSFGDMGFLPNFTDDDNYLTNNNKMVGEAMYDSIILSMPVKSDAMSLGDNINRDLSSGDNGADELFDSLSSKSNSSGNVITSDPTIDLGKRTGKKLRLRRSKYQKVSVELHDLDFEMTIFTNFDPTRDPLRPKDKLNLSETINSMDIKVRDFLIIDNVPTSTWNRFATYMTEAGIKEIGVSMFEMKIDTVRPISSLAATELIMDVHVLPLSLHVDQDTLDFLARFGEFKDNRFLLIDLYENIIYIQKFTVNAVRIKLDYKPKKIDYNGIRSGHTSEFMNFFILDEAEMVLKKVSLYGISGFPRLNKMLNDCWMPDIKSTQLSGVLAGLAPVRSIVKIGSGFRDLVAVPMKEYKKDGRVVRSLQQGAYVFAKTTSNELLKFGVKLAAGTQTALENAEGALGGEGSSGRLSSFRREQAAAEILAEEQLYAITDTKLLRKSKDKPNMEASLIGRSAYVGPMDQSSRGGYRKALDSFEEVDDDSDNDLPLTVRRSTSGRAAFGSNRDEDDQDHINDESLLDDDDDDDDLEFLALRDQLDDDERQRFVSLYADQPYTMREGFLAAYSSLGRNLSTARELLREAGSSISDSGTAKEALMAIAKATPVAVIRPMIGTTEAISKALLGGMNQLDPSQKHKAEEKYKSSN